MEGGKRLSSRSEERRTTGIEKETASECRISGERKSKEEFMKCGLNVFPSKGKKLKQSMIPIVKCEKNTCALKDDLHNQKHLAFPPRYSSTSIVINKRNEELHQKLKLLEEKEKSIAEYYIRIENIIRNFVLQKENDKSLKCKTSQHLAARRMTSEPSMFNNSKMTDDILSDFENNIQQISEIWLKTSNDFSNTLQNLKNSSSLDPKECEMESIRIQLAIKQAKSLTLVKTRDIIAEARKLFYNQEMIRRELENFLSHENLKSKSGEELKKNLEEKNQKTVIENIEKPKVGGTGDSYNETDIENSESNKKATATDNSEKEKEILKKHLIKLSSKKGFFEVEKSGSDETLEEPNKMDESHISSPETFAEIEIWMKELAKKNETITNLNSKIFELQKACNDHSLKYSQMQVRLAEFYEKIQWNQVLWKQIRKLKEQIKSLQQSNKQLESQKKELESRINRLDQELDKLIKINHLLNQKKCLLKSQSHTWMECKKSEKEIAKNKKGEVGGEDEFSTEEIILSEKQNAINQLKTILNTMIDQENFAHKQISVFQSKIEELEKSAKA